MPKLQILEKQYTRDFGLAINEWWQMEMRQCFEQYFGTGHSDYPIIHDGVSATILALPEEEQAIRQAVYAVFQKNSRLIIKYITASVSEAKETRRILQKLHHPLSGEHVSLLLERHRLLYPGIRICIRIPALWRKDYEGSAVGQRAIAAAYRGRKGSDGTFEAIDVALRKTSDILLRRQGIRVDAKFLRLGELVGLAHGHRISKSELVKRSKGFVAARGQVVATTTPLQALRHFGYALPKENTSGQRVLGTIAFQARPVRGRVKILKAIEQVHSFVKGDILVSPMTIPPFISAMKKAAAIVTDEGGLTCHAAIVARELKKPCIIGTKVATKVFKDGDLVEVDATKGIARKI